MENEKEIIKELIHGSKIICRQKNKTDRLKTAKVQNFLQANLGVLMRQIKQMYNHRHFFWRTNHVALKKIDDLIFVVSVLDAFFLNSLKYK